MPSSMTRRNLLLAASASAAACAGGMPLLADAAGPFASLEAASGARIGVAGLDTGTGRVLRHRTGERFAFCSTFKLVAVTAILKRSETEPGLLNRRLHYTAREVVHYSPVTGAHVETGMTVAEICAAALQYSDNTAANLMIRLLGGPAGVTGFARSIGDGAFRLDRWETTLNAAVPGDPRDTTTPLAMMTDLRRAALGPILGDAQRRQLVAWMEGCKTGLKRIRAAAPAGARVADKTGTGDNGTANDIAVIWPPGKAPVVLVVYITGQKRGAPDELVAAVAREALAALA